MNNVRLLYFHRKIECLNKCLALRSLWLGKNKIEEISGLENLIGLKQLDVQSNRLTSLGTGLNSLKNLSELYLASNQIKNVTGLPLFIEDGSNEEFNDVLNTIDLSNNGLSSIEGIQQIRNLEEFWMSGSGFDSFESLEPLSKLATLTCVYLEHSPIAKDFEYRKKLTQLIPSLEQLDASRVHHWKSNS